MSPTVFKENGFGKNTSKVEINISHFGIWLIVGRVEYFLSYKDYPWFKDAKVSNIYKVQF